MAGYVPEPLDTSNVRLDESLGALLERLAENTHEVWAAQRIKDGWTYGSVRDDAAKRHPCLIPYGDLPEAEREYDRRTALETLKLVTALGYEIRQVPKTS